MAACPVAEWLDTSARLIGSEKSWLWGEVVTQRRGSSDKGRLREEVTQKRLWQEVVRRRAGSEKIEEVIPSPYKCIQ